MSQFIDIYNDMLNANYSIDDIKLYFLIEHNIDILDFQHELKLNRFGQNYFRKCILSRFNNKCLISNSEYSLEACHIVPYADSRNMSIDNGILLSSSYHKLFDEYKWSINPNTLCVEINSELQNKLNDPIIKTLLDDDTKNHKKINVLINHKNTLKYLKLHYDKFINP